MSTEEKYKEKWEASIEKRFDRLDEEQMRQRSKLSQIEIRQEQVKEELHDVHKATDAIGKKLDSIAKEMPTVVLFRDRFDSILKRLLLGFVGLVVSGAVGLIIVAAKAGIFG